MNEAIYLGISYTMRPSNYYIACVIEDYKRGIITINAIAKKYELESRIVWALINEVLPDTPTGNTIVLKYNSSV